MLKDRDNDVEKHTPIAQTMMNHDSHGAYVQLKHIRKKKRKEIEADSLYKFYFFKK